MFGMNGRILEPRLYQQPSYKYHVDGASERGAFTERMLVFTHEGEVGNIMFGEYDTVPIRLNRGHGEGRLVSDHRMLYTELFDRSIVFDETYLEERKVWHRRAIAKHKGNAFPIAPENYVIKDKKKGSDSSDEEKPV